MKILSKDLILFFILTSVISIQKISNATDTITTAQCLRDGETLVSSDGSFELGFFSPAGNSKNRYVGMWYKKIGFTTAVWVANREVPLTKKSGVLTVTEPGRLVLLNDTNGGIIWSSNNTTRFVKNPVAKLLDTGNLVVVDANNDAPEDFVWESFNYPTDTLLPGMKLGWNFLTGLEVYLSSWRNSEDPSSGNYKFHLDPTGYPQYLLKRDLEVTFNSGPWNGLRYSGAPNLRENPIYSFGIVINKNETYYSYKLLDKSIISIFILNAVGQGQRRTWIDRTKKWKLYLTLPMDNCDLYAFCGAYGSCNLASSPNCGCLNRFSPKDTKAWSRADWSLGCVRRTPLDCQNGDKFLKYSGIKLPDTRYSWNNKSMTLDECRVVCLKNCSCTAYTQLNISSGSGCLQWFGELINIRELSEGQDIYIRMASSESDSRGRKRKILEVSLPLAVATVLLGLALGRYFQKMKKSNHKPRTGGKFRDDYSDGECVEIHNNDIDMFDFYTIVKATEDFSIHKKIGEGGFGPVYKGTLEDGQEIAVKRLSRNSVQGIVEFKNECAFIAKLQHRNLVKLLGYCVQGEENMLIYEYLPNKSLDLFLFDPMKSRVLDLTKRFHIINGIARGLMYLHQDSRLRIIHRDLKASNILLDSDMNPKISDFGLARSFRGNETEANTSRVAGTYGYMSPEYAIDGLFSIKSDVFSFGVLVLEIVSGQRNRGFSHKDHQHNLLGHAWMLYKEGRSLELADAHLALLGDASEVLRSIHVGLLCVQQRPEDRPSMSSVVLMLGNEGLLPEARQPGFFAERNLFTVESSSNTNATSSINEMTISLMEAR